MRLFRSLQESAFSDWLLGSESIWTYPLVLTLHTVGLAILVGASTIVFLRVLGVGAAIPPKRLRALYPCVWAGFAINLATGLILFVTQAADRVVDPRFGMKLGSIALAIWFGILIRRRALAPEAAPAERGRGRWLAASGLALWVVAIVTGRLMAY